MEYLWIKAVHVIFMVTWFAGLFYLPRLYVYHAQPGNQASYELFKIMERRLFAIMTIGAVITAVLGLWMILLNSSFLMSQGWFHAKLFFVLALVAYHVWCWKLMRDFRDDNNQHSEKWYRWFNEAPAISLIVVVILVILKPF